MTLGPVDFPTLGWEVCDWIEKYLRHGPGDVQGDPIVLDDELARFICHAYRLDDAGRRVHRRAVLSRPKGRAKSELAGMLVCAEALGPVRFDHFGADGEPKGKPVRSPFIRCLATEEDQSGNTYDNVQVMLRGDKLTQEYPGVDVGLTRVFLPNGGEITPSTASSAAKDGGKETFAVADETHLYVLGELRKMHKTVRRNLGKRKVAEPWMLDTTTAFRPGEQSIAEQTHETTDPGILVDHREAPVVKKWLDDREVSEALRQVYGPAAEWMDLGRLLAEIRDPTADQADSQRYWLNQIVASSDQWLSLEAWRTRRSSAEVDVGDLIAMGFDGSVKDDATALIGCRLTDGHLFKLGIWAKPSDYRGDDWEVPRAEVDREVHSAMNTYNVARLYCDPPYWRSEIEAWAAEFGDEVVIQFPTNQYRHTASALERLHTAVLTGDVSHDGNQEFEQHIANARKLEHRSGTLIQKEHKRSPRKIDAAMAATLAFEARADAVAAGALKPKSRAAVFI